MEENRNNSEGSHIDIHFYRRIGLLIALVSAILIAVIIFFLYVAFAHNSSIRSSGNAIPLVEEVDDFDRVENGIHVMTGLAYDDNFQAVRSSCTSCHSAQLIIQNRASREGWLEIIRWMQATQGLTDLGDREPQILDYLAKHYAPKDTGRRPNIDMAAIEWYTLNLE